MQDFFKLRTDGTDKSIVDAVNHTEVRGAGDDRQVRVAKTVTHTDDMATSDEAKKKEKEKKKQQEPSLKWKKLGIDEQK